ncbi:Coenzyme Q-binding protein coq10, mitochondrial [Collariella sp. IMI 366227]|nr:Coenzyme Q-binding protein coq10, mitochondrial [Collariella sp. IMI 366227]
MERQCRHPALADLTVGWGPFTQTYTSRIYCIPGCVVEAISGQADTSIPSSLLQAAGYHINETTTTTTTTRKHEMEGGIFESLSTRWEVKPVTGKDGREWTEVTLSVRFQFANPALGFAVGQLADEKAGEMVEAFEGRARELYGRR